MIRKPVGLVEIREGFPTWAWPLAWEWANARLSQIADDFFPSTIDDFVESYSVRFRDARTYGVWKNGSLCGFIIFEPASPVVVTAHILLAKRMWGVPVSELRAAAGLLFEAEPHVIRIQSFVPAWNRLAIALARRIGGKVEGTLRCATLRNGAPADAVLVGLTREDLNGTELRIEFGQHIGVDVGIDVEHILGSADVAPEPVGIESLEESGGSRRGHDGARRRSAEDGGGGHDQQDVERPDGPRQLVPRGARVRKVGRDGKRKPAGGARKGKRPGGK